MRLLGIDASRANVRERTGTEAYAFHLIQELKRIIPSGVRVRLYSREELLPDLARLPANWESRVLRWPPKRLWTQGRLSLEMLSHPPDVLFVPVHVLPLILPKRTAVTLHDVAFAVEPEAYGRFENWYQGFAVRFALRRADRVFSVSEFTRAELVERFRGEEDRISATPLGCDAREFARPAEQTVAETLARYGVVAPYFLFVGRLERKKNLDGMLAAFDVLNAQRSGAQLVLVGKPGHGYEEIMEKRERGVPKPPYRGQSPSLLIGDSPQVKELGFVPQRYLPSLYAGAAGLLFPSRYEGFGLPVLEAFAAGIPVIASDTSALPEVCGDAAILVDPERPEEIARAMRRLLMDTAFADELRVRGTERVNKCTWRATAEKTWEGLQPLLGG